MAANDMFGVDLHYTDSKAGNLPPTLRNGDSQELFKWFHSHPGVDTTNHIRVLCVRVNSHKDIIDPQQGFEVPLPPEIVQHAIWKAEVYNSLTKNPSGGAAALLDNPCCFTLQTPLDGGPFCSLALSKHGVVVKGIYFYSDDAFSPIHMPGGERSLSGWRSSGLQMITLPHTILKAHSHSVSQRLAKLVAQVKGAETTLATSDETPPDLGAISRTLHVCSAELIDLERRSRFEENVLSAMETHVRADSQHGKMPWAAFAPQQTAVTSRSFDFQAMPRRIENARATISNLIQQWNEQVNLELTQASFRIAEATLSDAKSMKTIAILTMVLLPGTAVASLFSMNMFDWSVEDGSHIASKWLWIYFVVTIPLTVLIMVAWVIWTRSSVRSTAWRGPAVEQTTERAFRDEEAGVEHASGSTSIEMRVTPAKEETAG